MRVGRLKAGLQSEGKRGGAVGEGGVESGRGGGELGRWGLRAEGGCSRQQAALAGKRQRAAAVQGGAGERGVESGRGALGSGLPTFFDALTSDYDMP